MTDFEKRFSEIKARAAAATPGPWEAREFGCSLAVDSPKGGIADTVDIGTDNDMRFIAHARADIPWLVEQVERLEKQIQQTEYALQGQVEKKVNALSELTRVQTLLDEERHRENAYIARLEARLRETLVYEYEATEFDLQHRSSDELLPMFNDYVDAEIAKLRGK